MANWQLKELEKGAVFQASKSDCYFIFDSAEFDLDEGYEWVGFDMDGRRFAEVRCPMIGELWLLCEGLGIDIRMYDGIGEDK